MAQTNPIRQNNYDTRKGVPKLSVYSFISGVSQLFKALPNSGKVIAKPSAKANYLPLNQWDTMLACAVSRL